MPEFPTAVPYNTKIRRNSVLTKYLLTCQRYRHHEIDLHQLQIDTWLTSVTLEDVDPRLSGFLTLADQRFGELQDKDRISGRRLALVLVEAAEKLSLKRLSFR